MEKKEKRKLSIPPYTLGEELWNAISHGIGALLAVAALVLMLVRARGALAVTAAALFGASLILLYAMSCLYHALSPRTEGKKVLRVLDHCNVFLLVFGTYIPVALLGVPGARGWTLFGAVALFTVLGVVFTAVDLERFQAAAVLCELLSGWSILIGFPACGRPWAPPVWPGSSPAACCILSGPCSTAWTAESATGTPFFIFSAWRPAFAISGPSTPIFCKAHPTRGGLPPRSFFARPGPLFRFTSGQRSPCFPLVLSGGPLPLRLGALPRIHNLFIDKSAFRW